MSSISASLVFLLLSFEQLTYASVREYHFDPTNRLWNESKLFCDTYYDGLAIIITEEDFNNAIYEIPLMIGHSITLVWIGLTDIEKEGDWKWVDGSKCVYNTTTGHDCSDFWYEGEPNNHHQDTGGENCGDLYYRHGAWAFNDVPCDYEMPTLCKKEFQYDYVWNGTFMNWTNAKQYCEENHGGIATIQSSIDYINAIQVIPQGVATGWIGLNDLKNEGNWEWANGATCIENKNISHDCSIYWMPGQPDDWNLGEDCGEIRYHRDGSAWLFNDMYCGLTQGVLCQESVVTAHPTSPPSADSQNAHYVFSYTLRTWADALMYCQENYYGLASITNDYELMVATQLIPTNMPYVWIGLNDVKDEGKWEWSNGHECSLNNNNCSNFWAEGEPDNFDEGEDCGQMRYYGDDTTAWKINDAVCDLVFPVLCSKNHTTYNPTSLFPTVIPSKVPTLRPTVKPSNSPTFSPSSPPVMNITAGNSNTSSDSSITTLNIILILIIILLVCALLFTLFCMVRFKNMYKRMGEMTDYVNAGGGNQQIVSIDDDIDMNLFQPNNDQTTVQ